MIGAVIPVGPGRHENLTAVLHSLEKQTAKDLLGPIVLVCDGPEAEVGQMVGDFPIKVATVTIPKHEPGQEQPRNVGVRVIERINQLRDQYGEAADDPATHVWFLDSDIILQEDALVHFVQALDINQDRILVGPYDWLPPDARDPVLKLKNDPRWPSFDNHAPDETLTNDLSAGLACFSGNLVWPIEEFKRVGGFWNDLHHGRCEDGELGLRAVAMGVPIGFVREARGWHLFHERNSVWIDQANTRDVPMLNARHPWVQGAGLFVVEEDGKRFDVRCPCGWEGNTALIWAHQAECPRRIDLGFG